MRKILVIFFIVVFLMLGSFLFYRNYNQSEIPTYTPTQINSSSTITSSSSDSDILVSPTVIPSVYVMEMKTHVFQTFNNCGPASLSMALSYHGIIKNQTELGKALRPYQVSNGDNDDKSTTLDELASKAEEFGLYSYHRPNGNPNLLKQFISHGMPVITVTWLNVDDDIGHYRVVRGYDDIQEVFIQDDSYQGKNLAYRYEEFNKIWQKFNYEYLVLVPKEKQDLAKQIMGDDYNEKVAWRNAVELSLDLLNKNPDDVDARFNLSVALYHINDYRGSVNEFEKVQNRLSPRTLWYQIEPIRAYYELGQYDKVISIADTILNKNNRAFSELYLLKGNIYLKQGNIDAARKEFENAVKYNENMKEAKESLDSVL